MEEILKKLVNDFNEKSKDDKKIKDKIGDLERDIVIEITDDNTYHMLLKDCKLTDFGVGERDSKIRIISDTNTFSKILNKEISPFKAYATKKLKIKAAFSDLLMIKSLF